MKSFFSTVASPKRTRLPLVPLCGACGLHKHCQSPKMSLYGKGRKGILVIGESPGSQEDERNIPFIGPAGQLLREKLAGFGIDLKRDCWVTNSLICHPESNATPTKDQINYCRPNIMQIMREKKPGLVILVGGAPIRSLIGYLWKEDVGTVSRWVGWNIPCQKFNCWICPTYHTSYLLRMNDPLLDRLLERHLKAALLHRSRPYKTIPNYREQVKICLDVDKAERIIDSMIDDETPVAFDYETNCLKPETQGAKIVCCSISDGERTIAYPWTKQTKDATGRLLQSKQPKIASNLKFEERWTRWQFGFGVRNWAWDTMVNAHVLDNREGITSIKFQSFVMLGQESYNDHIEPYLKADAGELNRIDKVNLRELLVYCGLDSLLEFLVMQKQKEMMGCYDGNS